MWVVGFFGLCIWCVIMGWGLRVVCGVVVVLVVINVVIINIVVLFVL